MVILAVESAHQHAFSGDVAVDCLEHVGDFSGRLLFERLF
jgi:hypothetical protein